MTKTHANKPTHRAFSVRETGTEKGFWTRIGSAWANKDGKGFNLKLDLLPLDGSTIVIREIAADDEPKDA